MNRPFTDPRSNPRAGTITSPARKARTPEELEALGELHRLCHEGRIYDVERWIQEGMPIQTGVGTPTNRRHRSNSALQIALQRGDHALSLLLLCNGYDPNCGDESPLDTPLRARRWDLLDLLLDWGADPHRVCLTDLFGTYSSSLFQRFRDLGVELTADHELAEALAYHTSNKPLYGFARRHREQDPTMQKELDMALAFHAGEGSMKGVSLCLWAGADAHAPAEDLRYGSSYGVDADDDDDPFHGFSAIYEACAHDNPGILERLGPDPERDDFDDLYRCSGNGEVIDVLARSALPNDVSSVIGAQLGWLSYRHGEWQAVDNLRRLFHSGMRWTADSKEEIRTIRGLILKLSDGRFEDVMKLLAEGDHSSSDVRRELARTPSIRARMRAVGFLPAAAEDPHGPDRYRPARYRELLSKFGVELPKQKTPERPLPRCVRIGNRRPDARQLTLNRAELFERVWSTPVSTLAEEWGLSDRGLGKACRRLKIPVPPRGHWAKKAAGQRIRRPRLPMLKPGEVEEIILWRSE